MFDSDVSISVDINPAIDSLSNLQWISSDVAGKVDYGTSIECPGSIQSYGVLLALSNGIIQQVSANTPLYFKLKPQSLLGQPLSAVLAAPEIDQITACLTDEFGRFDAPIVTIQSNPFYAIAHRHQNSAIVELEPVLSQARTHRASDLHRTITQLRKTRHLHEFLTIATQTVQTLTQFDRVVIYQFDQQGSGEVLAETIREGLPSYLGLHYPALDIPPEARSLYQQGMVRYVPHLTAPPVPLLNHSPTADPLDLSLTTLRSVHPCCVEFHHNMGVGAFLVIALVKDDQLWGLLTCQHSTPLALSPQVRRDCDLLGQFLMSELAHKVDDAESHYQLHLHALQSEFTTALTQTQDLRTALQQPPDRFLDLVGATGAAIVLGDDLTLLGKTPTEAQIRSLLTWTDTQGDDSIFHTNALPRHYPPAAAFKTLASGLLLLRVSLKQRYFLLWFRPEVLQTVTWAGNPNYPVSQTEAGYFVLGPRRSFEQWQETVRLTSLPWKPCELNNAIDLRQAIAGIVLKKADELAQINHDLERSNRELDAFMYAASHDLKEPLRGIHNYATVLLEDYAEVLDAEGLEYAETLVMLSQRMESLINVLLRLSQLKNLEFQRQATDLNRVVKDAIAVLRASYPNVTFDVRVPRSLPTIDCESVLINELFSNLLSNAFKYNNAAQPWAEVGFTETEAGLIFYVRDNGIGIRDHHLDLIFKLFKRLHVQEEYGGGTGAGLAIAKKIVERHHGTLWVESTYGEGSTFYFKLQ